MFTSLLLVFVTTSCIAQVGLSSPNKTDSVQQRDTFAVKNFQLTKTILSHHPFFNFRDKAVHPEYIRKRNSPGKEIYFYIIAGLLLIFAVLKTGFEKYFSDLMHLFLRRSLKQRQLKQQLIRDSLPSLLFNIFFVIVAGFYAALITEHFEPSLPFNFWQLFACCSALIGCVYLCKYFILKFIGWAFRIEKLTDNYIFLIFLVNKVFAIALLPLLILIALGYKNLSAVAWTLSWVLLTGLIIYRYFAAISLVRKEKGVNFFHFILYVAAFEILPTLILHKALLLFLK